MLAGTGEYAQMYRLSVKVFLQRGQRVLQECVAYRVVCLLPLHLAMGTGPKR